MNKINISPEAQNDMQEISKYITMELNNPIAAQNMLRKITERIKTLAEHASIGAPLSGIVDFDNDYRYLVCGNYLVFYRTEEKQIYVDRVLYGRRDYLRILFGELPD